MATYVVAGVEKIEYAPASPVGVVTESAWKTIENIAPGSVKFTENQQTKSSIIPEDKDVAFVNFYAPAEGDFYTLGVLEQNPTLIQELYNVKYTAAKTLLEYKAIKKIPNLALRFTTRSIKDGRKTIITAYNTEVQTGTDGNLTKDAVEQKVLTATLNTYRPAGETEDYLYSKQTVKADGTVIDSTVV